MSALKFRPLRFGVTRAVLREGAPGIGYLRADQDLKDYPARITDRLQHWRRPAALPRDCWTAA
jgi:feruloyl-CoA synthase